MGRRAVSVLAVAILAVLASASAAAPQAYPPSGEAIVSPSTVAPGGTITVSVDGCAADSQATVTLFSDPVVLGTLTADGTGHVQGSFTIPSDVTPGAHIVHVECTGRTVDLSITVEAASASRGGLAFTGGSDGLPAIVGIAAVALGAVLIAASRKRRSSVSSS